MPCTASHEPWCVTPQAVSWLFAWHEAALLVGMQTHYWGPAGEGAIEGLRPGDVLASKPSAAGRRFTHLPDITVITPVFNKGRIEYASCDLAITSDCCKEAPSTMLIKRCSVGSLWLREATMPMWVALRLVSMPPNSRRLVEEGAAIIAYKLVREGRFQGTLHGFFLCDYSALCGSS